MDEQLYQLDRPEDVSLTFLVCAFDGICWTEESAYAAAVRPYSCGTNGYGGASPCANYNRANAIAVFERGDLLSGGRAISSDYVGEDIRAYTDAKLG